MIEIQLRFKDLNKYHAKTIRTSGYEVQIFRSS